MITKEDIKYTHEKVKFYVDDTYQFTIDNDIELNNVRLWVILNKIKGSYIIWRDKYKLTISENGTLSQWPGGFYDQQMPQLTQIMMLQSGKKYTKFPYDGIIHPEPFYITN